MDHHDAARWPKSNEAVEAHHRGEFSRPRGWRPTEFGQIFNGEHSPPRIDTVATASWLAAPRRGGSILARAPRP